MQCVTPMFRRYEIGNYKNGHVVSRKEVMQGLLDFSPNYISYCLEKMNHINSKFRYETIPCGHCWACNLNYSAQWATRLTYECQKYQHNYFVTLTYDEQHLPIAETIKIGDVTWENEGEEIWQEGTVWEPHMHKFLHDLRQYLQRRKNHTGLKYYYCAEYGENTHRPHYHIILMNCPLDMSQWYDWFRDDRFKLHWKTPELEQFWKNGMIDVAECEWSCCAYVARYCMKKLHTKNNYEYAEEGKLPEFVRMSRNLGRDYYEKNKLRIYQYDEIIMRTVQGNIGAFKPPKAWDKLFQKEHPEQWEQIKKSRQKAAERSRKLTKQLSDYTDYQKTQMNYEKIVTKGKMLPRVGEWN